MIANLVEAEALIILTDQDGMFDRDPRHDSSATLLPEVRAMDETLFAMAGGGGALGRGGMITKVRAARFAARSGCATVIAMVVAKYFATTGIRRNIRDIITAR